MDTELHPESDGGQAPRVESDATASRSDATVHNLLVAFSSGAVCVCGAQDGLEMKVHDEVRALGDPIGRNGRAIAHRPCLVRS